MGRLVKQTERLWRLDCTYLLRMRWSQCSWYFFSASRNRLCSPSPWDTPGPERPPAEGA